MKVFSLILWLLALQIGGVYAHSDTRRELSFPDVPGYFTLKCDLHMHTVFSDGNVWPSIRVDEAIRDDLDAISITDHLEKLKHRDDIPMPDRNRSYDVAKEAAENSDLIVIRGTEITRSMPPGHGNAIFLKDTNLVLVDDPVDAYRAANKQGAFVFWNHPMWISQAPDGVARLTDLHKQLIAEELLHGIEVVNEDTYSDEALQIALENNLTILGTSDIHGLIDWQYNVPDGGHRPLTLALARERSAIGIKEALEARRTIALINDTLIGRHEHVVPLVKASLIPEAKGYMKKSSVASVIIKNSSSVTYILENLSGYTMQSHSDVLTVEAMTDTEIQIRLPERVAEFKLSFRALNVVTAPQEHPLLNYTLSIRTD